MRPDAEKEVSEAVGAEYRAQSAPALAETLLSRNLGLGFTCSFPRYGFSVTILQTFKLSNFLSLALLQFLKLLFFYISSFLPLSISLSLSLSLPLSLSLSLTLSLSLPVSLALSLRTRGLVPQALGR